jgi:hypothetical protein
VLKKGTAVSNRMGRTYSLTLALTLGLAGCVVHVHEKAEAGSSTQSSGGETASTTKPATQPATRPVGSDKPGTATPSPTHGRTPVVVRPADKPAVDKPADKPATGPSGKPLDTSPVAGDKLTGGLKPGVLRPGDKPADKPVDKPADKPAVGQGDKPINTLPVTGDKLTGGVKPGVVKPGDKPTDKPADKPADKPDAKDPQGPPDKPGLAVDKPVTFTDRDRTKLGQTQRVDTATDKDKGKPNQQGLAGTMTGASGVAGGRVAMDAAPCQLYSRNVEAGGKLRLKVLEARDDAQVLLDDKPLVVTKRDPKAWVVAIAEDAKSGRVTLKDGDKSVACGRIEVR